MYQYKIGISAQEMDDFTREHPQGTLLQSSSWATIKDNWQSERLGVYCDNHLVATALILIKPLPLGYTILYIPRGPIMDYQDQELVAFVFSVLRSIGKDYRALYVKLDPFLFLSRKSPNQQATEEPLTWEIIQTLQESRAVWMGRTRLGSDTIQPRVQAFLYAPSFSEETLSKSSRQTLRTTRNKGVTTKIGGLDLLSDFSLLMEKTENRKQISLRDKTYYQKLLEIYPGEAYITLSQLDVAQRLAEVTAQLETSKKEETSQRLQEEQTLLIQLQKEGKNRLPLAGTLTIAFGKTSENLYAGMDAAYRRYQPALLTWYETAAEAFRRGIQWHNLGGVENDLDGGLYAFKTKLCPTIEELIGEFDLPVHPLYTLVAKIYTWRKKWKNR